VQRTLQTTRERSHERSGGLAARSEATAEAAYSRPPPEVQHLPGTRSGRPEPGYQGHVRPNGRAGSAGSRRPRGHVCCLYDDVGEFRRRLADGSVRILSLQDVYGDAHPVDRNRVVGLSAAATEQALADGFRGLRVGADGSELVRSPATVDALARYEFVAGRYMFGHALSALCGYRLDLGHETVNGLHALRLRGRRHRPRGAVRPDQRHGAPAAPDPHPAGVDDGTVVIDMADVEYVDHRLLRALSAHARKQGVALSLRSAPPFAARLMELLASCLQHAEEGTDT
jgi:hypothetical protein